MNPLKIQYKTFNSGCQTVRVEATLRAVVDRVNELSEKLNCDCDQAPEQQEYNGHTRYCEAGLQPKRFKADDIRMVCNWGETRLVFKSEAEAQAALEALLNL